MFTESRFGGNPLAVLPEAQGLSEGQMQQIAREFNFSETTFVFPAEAGHTRRVRIFTPHSEIPFAGHPNLGTAFCLARTGWFGDIDASLEVCFEEEAGAVPVSIRTRADGVTWCELEAPQRLSLGPEVDPGHVAAALSLEEKQVVTTTHAPRVASVGLPFVIAELRDRTALEQARPVSEGLARIEASGVSPILHLYVKSGDDFDLRARMFAPGDGVPEDPATGSASCALAGLLAHHDAEADGEFRWRIAQGVEMGRPSVLDARASKRGGAVERTWVGGSSVLVSEGFIEVDDPA